MSARIIPLFSAQPVAQPCVVSEDEWDMWPARKPRRLRIDVHKGTAREWAIAFAVAASALGGCGARDLGGGDEVNIERKKQMLELGTKSQAPIGDYDYWLNALAGNFGPVHDSDIQCGFWRKRISRGGPFVPVAVWRHDGEIIALLDGRPVDDPRELWTYICRYPVTEDAYRGRVETGKWSDEDAAVSQSLQPPTIGDNNPPTDEAEIIKGQIEAASAGVADYAEITDDATAAKAQSLRSRLLELNGLADKRREALKKPHLEAGRDIDAKWQPLVKAAKAAADVIAKALGAHETRKANAAAKALAEAAETRRKVEEVARVAAEAGKPIPLPIAPAQDPPTPEPVMAIRGAYGRAAAVKVVKVATVEDYDEATTYFRNNAEYRAVIDKLAQRAVDAGLTVPGVVVTEERKVS